MIPATQPKSGRTPAAMRCTSNYPCFCPAACAIDTVIPLINVRQAALLDPNGQAPWGTRGDLHLGMHRLRLGPGHARRRGLCRAGPPGLTGSEASLRFVPVLSHGSDKTMSV
jgi:hypothetical protein